MQGWEREDRIKVGVGGLSETKEYEEVMWKFSL